jgi:hypothetical protein
MNSSHDRRLSALEYVLHQARQAKISRLVAYMDAHLSAAEHSAFCAALERNLRDGDKAQYTEVELAAAWRFDEVASMRPDIVQLIESLAVRRRGNGGTYA